MKKTSNGIPVYTQYELVDALKQNPFLDVSHTFCSNPDSYNKTIDKLYLGWSKVSNWDDTISIEDFHKQNQSDWLMPGEFKAFDICGWLIGLCKTDQQRERVNRELDLYKKFDLLMLLKYLRYLVTIIREHKIVLGVGRGSSCASYCLFLMGIHRVDPLLYNLEIEEFLREK